VRAWFLLTEKGWIEQIPGKDTKSWRLAREGAMVLHSLEEVEDVMRDFGLGL
jgi:hypothetical protein